MILFRVLDWLVNIFALTILAGLFVGISIPRWIAFLLIGAGVGLFLARHKQTGGAHRAT